MAENLSKEEREEGHIFAPQFNNQGLMSCITVSVRTKKVLMFAFMNEEALNKTIETGEMYYWSRSREELWHKGATSGHIQKVVELRTDCDQDCILAIVDVEGDHDIACHTGRESCFYRKIGSNGNLIY